MAAAAGAAAAATAEAGEAADEETQEKRVKREKELIDFSIQFFGEWRQKPREENKLDESKISLFVESVI